VTYTTKEGAVKMEYDWLYFAGWINMLRPPFLFFLIILIVIYASLISVLILAIFRIPKKTYSFLKVSLSVSAISFCVFVIEGIFTHVFTTIMHYNDPRYGFVDTRDNLGLSSYENTTLFLFTLISVCLCIYITYRLNRRFTARLLAKFDGNKKPAIVLISLLTSPFIFFASLKEIIYFVIPFRIM
jgi:hypothetical protein